MLKKRAPFVLPPRIFTRRKTKRMHAGKKPRKDRITGNSTVSKKTTKVLFFKISPLATVVFSCSVFFFDKTWFLKRAMRMMAGIAVIIEKSLGKRAKPPGCFNEKNQADCKRDHGHNKLGYHNIHLVITFIRLILTEIA